MTTPVQRLHDAFSERLQAAGNAGIDPQLRQDIAQSDLAKEIQQLDAETVAEQLEELKKTAGPAVVDVLRESALSPDQRAKVGVVDFGEQGPTGIGPRAQSAAMFDPRLQERVARVFDEKQGASVSARVDKVISEDADLLADIRNYFVDQKENALEFAATQRERLDEMRGTRESEREANVAGIKKQEGVVREAETALGKSPDDKKLQRAFEEAKDHLSALRSKHEMMEQKNAAIDFGELERAVDGLSNTEDFDFFIKKIDEGKVDPALEAVIAHYAGFSGEWMQRVKAEGRMEETTEALKALPPQFQPLVARHVQLDAYKTAIEDALKRKDGQEIHKLLEAMPEDYKPDLQPLLDVIARENLPGGTADHPAPQPTQDPSQIGGLEMPGHSQPLDSNLDFYIRVVSGGSLATPEGFHFLRALSASEDKGREAARDVLGLTDDGKINQFVELGHRILNTKAPGLKNGEFYTMRELFQDNQLIQDAKIHSAALEGKNPGNTSHREQKLRRMLLALASSRLVGKINDQEFSQQYTKALKEAQS
ncbi:MAG: hypothetical protein AAF658_04685, partial [Myxococcota bacterium]